MHFPTHIQQARPDVILTILKFLSFLYPLNSTFDGFHLTFKCYTKNIRRKPSSGFEFEIISIRNNLRFIDLTPPVACYVAPEMSFVEPFVICPESSKDTCNESENSAVQHDSSVPPQSWSNELWFYFFSKHSLACVAEHLARNH